MCQNCQNTTNKTKLFNQFNHDHFLSGISTLSKDNSTKVSAILLNSIGTIVSYGYNGLPRGMNDSNQAYQNKKPLADRLPNEDKLFYKYDLFEHAESNAIYNWAKLNTLIGLDNNYMIISKIDNANDIKAIISSGIKRIYVLDINPNVKPLFQHLANEVGLKVLAADIKIMKIAAIYKNATNGNHFCVINSKEHALISFGQYGFADLALHKIKQKEQLILEHYHEIQEYAAISPVKNAIYNLISQKLINDNAEYTMKVNLAPCFSCSLAMFSCNIKWEFNNENLNSNTNPTWIKQQELFNKIFLSY